MALTTFVDGSTVVTAAFLNSIFNTGGGHKHDGSGNDGSAGQIDLETEVDFGADMTVTLTESASNTLALEKGTGVFNLDIDGSFSAGVAHIAQNYCAAPAGFFDDLRPATLGATVVDFYDGVSSWYSVHCDALETEGDLTVGGSSVAFGSADVTTTGTLGCGDVTCGDVDCNDLTLGGNLDSTVGTNTFGDATVTGTLTAPQVPAIVAHVTGTTVDKDVNSSISSVTNSVTGNYVVTLGSAVTDTNVPVIVTPEGTRAMPTVAWSSTTQFTVQFEDAAGALTNVTGFSLVLWDF